MVLSAVIASLLLSLLLFVVTAIDVASLISHVGEYVSGTGAERKILKTTMVAHTVGAIDGFLLATILLIFSLGLYELFISEIDMKDSNHSSKVLVINSLDDLKSKLAKVILMILVVTFFEVSLTMDFVSPLDLVYFSFGIFLVSLALYFSAKSKH
ncbi:membrane protein [uncultured Candidatus Thioglobus sp.]|nr:membrane protein [uncultured Candidatus Thioglobus sp.]